MASFFFFAECNFSEFMEVVNLRKMKLPDKLPDIQYF